MASPAAPAGKRADFASQICTGQRPQLFEDRPIPEVLNNGNHSEIAKFRVAQAETLTQARRPDLWTLYEKTKR